MEVFTKIMRFQIRILQFSVDMTESKCVNQTVTKTKNIKPCAVKIGPMIMLPMAIQWHYSSTLTGLLIDAGSKFNINGSADKL